MAEGASAVGADESSRVLVARIAQAMMAACPPGWQRAQVRWQQVGQRQEHDGAAVCADGTEFALTMPDEVLELFSQLRQQQHSTETGSWFSARVRLAHPDRFALDTDADEPQLSGAPPEVADYVQDVAALPWSESARPLWLSGILDAAELARQVSDALRRLDTPASAVVVGNSAVPDVGWVVSRSAGRWLALCATERPQECTTAWAAAAYAVGHVALAAKPTSPPAEEVFRAGQHVDALPGDPPLSLFHGLRLLVVLPGTLLDRLGTPQGNVTYLAGTPFPMRSLPPELTRQPCTVYRVRRPVEVLVGEAMAWFGQPGGGTAFVLPRSVGELLGLGVLENPQLT